MIATVTLKKYLGTWKRSKPSNVMLSRRTYAMLSGKKKRKKIGHCGEEKYAEID